MSLKILFLSLTIISPYISGRYIDELLRIKTANIVIYYTIIILFVNILSILLSYMASITMAKISTSISYKIKSDIIDHVKKLPLKVTDKYDPVYLSEKLNSDAVTITSFVMGSCIDILLTSTFSIVSLYILARINISITLIMFLIFPLYILSYKYFKNALYNSTLEYKESSSRFFSEINNQFKHLKLIKINSLFKLLSERLEDSFSMFYKSLLSTKRITTTFSSIGKIFFTLTNVIVFFVGGLELIKGNLSIGNFTIINIYINRILNNLNKYLDFSSTYQKSLVSYNRLVELTEIEPEINGSMDLTKIDAINVYVKNFSYNVHKCVIKDFRYTFEKGNIYAILGDNGSGKSTLINILLGLYREFEGEVTYNSVNINKLDLYSIRKNIIGVTEQEPILLKDSIYNNITFGSNSCKKTDVENLCMELNFNNFINKQPKKINSMIYENSNNISGGEKQKISLARSILKNPDVLILDEPISALDSKSIEFLKNKLIKIKKEKIIIIITHNASILNIVDKTIRL